MFPRPLSPETGHARVRAWALLWVATVLLLNGCSGGQSIFQRATVKPRTLRDVPVERLAFRFEGDVAPPPGAAALGVNNDKLMPELQTEFDLHRPQDALIRTVLAPDKQRVLAIYAPTETPEGEFRIDLYGADGHLIKQVTPEGLSGAFAPMVGWSPDGNFISFMGRRAAAKPPPELPPDLGPLPPGITPTPTPVTSTVPVYDTEQIYLATRDGTDLRPLTMRPGLIYFYYAWAPDSRGLVALACLEGEWIAREAEGLSAVPAGRPRVIALAGKERLLDDKLSTVLPVWCPDGSKIATAYEYDVKLYDAVGDKPGQAVAPLHDPVLTASKAFDLKNGAPGGEGDPVSLYPVANLMWPDPKTLYLRTGYVPRSESDRPVNVFSRWHAVQLSAQAALLN